MSATGPTCIIMSSSIATNGASIPTSLFGTHTIGESVNIGRRAYTVVRGTQQSSPLDNNNTSTSTLPAFFCNLVPTASFTSSLNLNLSSFSSFSAFHL